MSSFITSQPIALAIIRVSDLTWLFHYVKALSAKVQAANLTLLPSGQEQISKIDSVFSHHCRRVMIPPVPLKVLGLQFVKSLYEHSLELTGASLGVGGTVVPLMIVPAVVNKARAVVTVATTTA